MNIPDLSAARWRKSSHSSDTGGDCVEIAPVLATARWRKSTRSSSTGGECVEIADLTPAIAVRDSTNPDGPVLAFDRRAFGILLNQIRTGRYSL